MNTVKRFAGLKILSVVVLLFAIIFFLPLPAIASANLDADKGADYLEKVLDLIDNSYVGEVDEDQILRNAIEGMFYVLDPYTEFLTVEETKIFTESVGGTFYGVGIVLEEGENYVNIIQVLPSSPAEAAGILQGDAIARVDGKDMKGKTPQEVQSVIRGDYGTQVNIGVIRCGHEDILYFNITRDLIKTNPVRYEIKDGIGYIKIDSFNSSTVLYVNEALADMDKNGVKDIIIDLRNNPGGQVNQAVSVARQFVANGVITRLEFKSEKYWDEVYRSYLDESEYDLAVLVNGNTASAAEIVTGAVKDNKAGVVIGTRTFGKAKVQGLIPILKPEAIKKYKDLLGVTTIDANDLIYLYGVSPSEDELLGYVKMTLGSYYTPAGSMIDGKGIIPNITITNPPDVNGIDLSSIIKLSGTVKPGLQDRGTDVYNAEKMLKALGYDVYNPDTLLDEKTFAAITKFQKDSNLYPYGVLDFTTQEALNSAINKLILKYDKQYAKAVEILKSN